jgi:hypothetical protein
MHRSSSGDEIDRRAWILYNTACSLYARSSEYELEDMRQCLGEALPVEQCWRPRALLEPQHCSSRQ